MAKRREQIGEILVTRNVITREQLDEVLDTQRVHGGLIGEILVRSLATTEEQIADALAEQRGLARVNLLTRVVNRQAAVLVPERLLRARHMIPIDKENDEIVLAMANPLDIEAIDDVRIRTGLEVVVVVGTSSQIDYAIDKYVSSADMVAEIKSDALAAPDVTAGDEDASSLDDAPIVRLVAQIFRDAVVDRASDVHIEPTKTAVRIRYRVDGVLHQVMDLPRSTHSGIVSRIKVLSDMDLAERRRPQDGRIPLVVDGRAIDLRIATVPTPDGESGVIRVLAQEAGRLTLQDLGMDPRDFEIMEGLLRNPFGAIFVSGPTGSGKSTSLYAALQLLNAPGRKIVTIEDPIEYRLDGVTQIATNSAVNLTFATLLRTVVRFDPDVVLVGEVRDSETAEIATRAALTGHLVLSSIHTNDAASTLTRLSDMGVPEYVTSSALLGIVAQRLVRKLCEHCKQPDTEIVEALREQGFSERQLALIAPMKAVGCDECGATGYKGRIGIFELMVMSDDLRRAFLRGAASDELSKIATASGMRTLRRDGLNKVAAGQTSLVELERVVA